MVRDFQAIIGVEAVRKCSSERDGCRVGSCLLGEDRTPWECSSLVPDDAVELIASRRQAKGRE